jgi:peptidoglycan/LPS O-acetylase OafA/YrhL
MGICAYWLWNRGGERVSRNACWLLAAAGLAGLSVSLLIGFPFVTTHWGILDQDAGILRPIWWALPYSMLVLSLLWLTERSLMPSRSIVWRSLRSIGDASYSLYLVHLTVIFAWEDLAPTNKINSDLVIFALLSTSIGLALTAYRFVEVPMLRSLRQRLLRRTEASAARAPV